VLQKRIAQENCDTPGRVDNELCEKVMQIYGYRQKKRKKMQKKLKKRLKKDCKREKDGVQ
jgi:hypothetical protein